MIQTIRRARLRAQIVLATALYVALAGWAIGLAVTIANNGILSGNRNLGILVNSDSLLPAQMAWDLHHNGHAWAWFQWPRVPSLIPDMVYFWGAELSGLSWRQALLGYNWVIMTAFAGAIGMAAFHLQVRPQRSLGLSLALAAILQCALVVACYLGQAAYGIMAWKDLLTAMVPATHGDGMLFSLLATIAAAMAAEGNHRARRLALALCFLGSFCDLLFVLEFLLPFAAVERWPNARSAWAASIADRQSPAHGPPARGLRRHIPFVRQFLRMTFDGGTLVKSLALASLIGWALTHLLYRQSVTALDIKSLVTTVPAISSDLVRSPWTAATVLATALLVLYVRKDFAKAQIGAAGTHDRVVPVAQRQLILGTAAGASVTSLAMFVPLYVDISGWRYAIAAEIWPATVLIAVIAMTVPRIAAVAAGALFLLLVTTAFPAELRRGPDLLLWHSDAEQCLLAAGRAHRLHAGLALYWDSRQTEASSDWKQQVTLIDELGRRRVWGNDTWYFTHDMAHVEQPARFNFILVDKAMRVMELNKRYGIPAWVYQCPGRTVWIYDHDLAIATTPYR